MASPQNSPVPVLICGVNPNAGHAPFLGGVERWGMAWCRDDSFDAYFDPHDPWVRSRREYEALEAPVYVMTGEAPNAVRYPIKEVTAVVGEYLECTTSFMLGLAIYQGRTDISLFGISGTEEYSYQRPNLEYLIGFARGQGAKVTFLSETTLLTSHWDAGIYGAR